MSIYVVSNERRKSVRTIHKDISRPETKDLVAYDKFTVDLNKNPDDIDDNDFSQIYKFTTEYLLLGPIFMLEMSEMVLVRFKIGNLFVTGFTSVNNWDSDISSILRKSINVRENFTAWFKLLRKDDIDADYSAEFLMFAKEEE